MQFAKGASKTAAANVGLAKDAGQTGIWTLPPKGPADHTHSGDERIALGTFGPDTVVERAVVKVSGAAFRGKVADLAGAEVTKSPAVYAVTGAPAASASGHSGFIVDFGGMRSILQVRYGPDPGTTHVVGQPTTITVVLPWMGTQFGAVPLYPGAFAKVGTGPPASGVQTVNLTGIDTQKLYVQVNASVTPQVFAQECRLTTATLPTGVRASVNERLPFWTNAGPLSDEVSVTGLADDLNALLSEADEPIAVELLITADMPGVMKVNFVAQRDLEIVKSADARWGGSSELEVALRSLEPQLVRLLWEGGPATWSIDRLELDLAGDFPPWRAHPLQDDDVPGMIGLSVSGRFAVARRASLEEGILLYGIALLVRPAGDAEVALELQTGALPDPAGTAPLAAAELVVAAADSERWFEVLFPSPVEVPAGPLWLVAKARKGTIEWTGVTGGAEAEPVSLFSDQGSRFEPYPALGTDVAVAQARLLRAPLPSENEELAEIVLQSGSETLTRGTSPGDDAITIELEPSAPVECAPVDNGIALELTATAKATGTLTIRRARAFYGEKP